MNWRWPPSWQVSAPTGIGCGQSRHQSKQPHYLPFQPPPSQLFWRKPTLKIYHPGKLAEHFGRHAEVPGLICSAESKCESSIVELGLANSDDDVDDSFRAEAIGIPRGAGFGGPKIEAECFRVTSGPCWPGVRCCWRSWRSDWKKRCRWLDPSWGIRGH